MWQSFGAAGKEEFMTTEQLNNITNELQNRAEKKMQKEIDKATKYKEGYVQACEDMYHAISNEILQAATKRADNDTAQQVFESAT